MTEQPSRLRREWQGCCAAFGLLTIVPVSGGHVLPESAQRASVAWYPAVGLLIGLVLLLAALWATGPAPLQAALVLLLWVVLTGALHLDGLADCADAWLGGLGDRERTLALLKDPLCGAIAVVAIVMTLLLKWAALWTILDSGIWHLLWLAPMVGRASVLGLFLTTDYVREQGMGSVVSAQLDRRRCQLALFAVAMVSFIGVSLWLWCALLAAALLVFVLVRASAQSRLGGFTGDVAGALVELQETAILLLIASQVA